jgi:hypothetical protein
MSKALGWAASTTLLVVLYIYVLDKPIQDATQTIVGWLKHLQ